MRLQPWLLIAVGAVIDTVVAAALMAYGLTLAAAAMAVVAVGGFVLAWVLRQRSPG